MSSWSATFSRPHPGVDEDGHRARRGLDHRRASASVGEPAVAPETQMASGSVAKTVVRVMGGQVAVGR